MAMFRQESKTFKLTFMATSTWRKMFLIRYNELYKKKKKIVFDRSSTVPITFAFNSIRIYNGSKLKTRRITKWMIGFKFGEFTLNRKLAIFKAKQRRKKMKKQLKAEQKTQKVQKVKKT